jgi:hypothetical protein
MNIRLRFSAAHQSGAARIESRRNNNVDELAEEQKKRRPYIGRPDIVLSREPYFILCRSAVAVDSTQLVMPPVLSTK